MGILINGSSKSEACWSAWGLLECLRLAGVPEACWSAGGLLECLRLVGVPEACWSAWGLLECLRLAGAPEACWSAWGSLERLRLTGAVEVIWRAHNESSLLSRPWSQVLTVGSPTLYHWAIPLSLWHNHPQIMFEARRCWQLLPADHPERRCRPATCQTLVSRFLPTYSGWLYAQPPDLLLAYLKTELAQVSVEGTSGEYKGHHLPG